MSADSVLDGIVWVLIVVVAAEHDTVVEVGGFAAVGLVAPVVLAVLVVAAVIASDKFGQRAC